MGRRGGGRMGCGVNRKVLLLRLDSYCQSNASSKHQTLDDIVHHLRSCYPEYRRFKDKPLAEEVESLLQNTQISQNSGITRKKKHVSTPLPSPSVAADRSPSRKKLKKIDASEERLLRAENRHLQRRSSGHDCVMMDESSSFSLASSSSSSEEEEDGALSDAVYREKAESFDLTREILRMNYVNQAAATNAAEAKSEEKNVEVEVGGKAKKMDLVQGEELKRVGADSVRKDGSSAGDGGEVKGKGGPMFKDLGGMEEVVEELKMEVIVPLYHPQLPQWLGVRPMAGILLHGPPGCGKTKLAHAIANETGVPFYQISATEVVSGVSGASEENIRDLFSKAYRTAPSIVFIDEIDAIASKRENLQREMERRIVTQLMTCMDESHRLSQRTDGASSSETSDQRPGYVLVIGATNRPDAVDPALRRPGRFDREIVLGVPDENARIEILTVLTRHLKLEGSFDLMKIARSTPGFVGADLDALANKAGNLALKRIIDKRRSELLKQNENMEEWWRHPRLAEELENLSITMNDFVVAAKMVQPSSRREGFSTIPNVKWEDVGGLDRLRQEFDRYIVRRIKYPEDYMEFGVDLETGFLLYGPPGCGKTLIAKAVANEAGANFIHIKGPELLNKYVGESELAVRTIFSRARTCSPCILFFDEVDALTTKRGKEGGWVVERLLNQLLIELDGADKRRGVFVIGATNRPEVMDPALLRPGRFGRLLFVPLPSPDECGLILKALARKKPIDAAVDLVAIGQLKACENLSGADLAALLNEAAMAALDEKLLFANSGSEAAPWTIKMKHFEQALKKISPSVSDEQNYDPLSGKLKIS